MESAQAVPAVQKGLMVFSYEGIRLKESCWIAGKPYFTRRAIGEFLEYPHPNKSMDKIIQRNPYIKQFATTVNLTVVEGVREVIREVDVFDPIGLQLIIFESHQPKANQYKIAVAHLVYDYASGNLKPFKWGGDVSSALSQIISIRAGKQRNLKVVELANELNKAKSTIYSMAKRLNGENLNTRAGKPKNIRKDKNSFFSRTEFLQVIEYRRLRPDAQGREIRKAIGISVTDSTINRWIRSLPRGDYKNGKEVNGG